jgi:hypothetical protein
MKLSFYEVISSSKQYLKVQFLPHTKEAASPLRDRLANVEQGKE